MSAKNEFITGPEAAELLRVTQQTLYLWRKRGEGPPWARVGPRRVTYRRSRLLEYVEASETGRVKRKPGRPKGSKNKTTAKPRKREAPEPGLASGQAGSLNSTNMETMTND